MSTDGPNNEPHDPRTLRSLVRVVRDIKTLSVGPSDSIRQAIKCIDQGRCGIVLVLDAAGRLLDTLTDGDIRRAILGQKSLDGPLMPFVESKSKSSPVVPVTAPVGTTSEALAELMRAHTVRQVPLLNVDGVVVDLVLAEDILPVPPEGMRAVIMAGGFGTRLLPLTEDVPKPMLPVGGRPVLEHIIAQLQEAGIQHVNVSTHYKPEKIMEYFGDGQAFGVDLNYVNEDRPLGTGGALGLMARPRSTQLVINGDILTQVNFRAMLSFHHENDAAMTLAVRQYDVKIPYGVIECDGARVSSLKEKPSVGFLVNAGIYLLEPLVYEFIPNGRSFNMTDLIHWLLEAALPVISFPIREYWLDVGHHGDYALAQDDASNGRLGP